MRLLILDFLSMMRLQIDRHLLVGKVELTKESLYRALCFVVQQFEDETTAAKLTIPAPAQFIEQSICL